MNDRPTNYLKTPKRMMDMCGRFTLYSAFDDIIDQFDIDQFFLKVNTSQAIMSHHHKTSLQSSMMDQIIA